MTHEHARFVFKGTFQPASFVEFAQHRAERLGLDLQFGQASMEAVALNVSGATELVDAFEMACSLGPLIVSCSTWCAMMSIWRREGSLR